MEHKFKKSHLFIIPVLLIIMSLILSNGCKKSEPEPGSTTSVSGNNMTHSETAMEGMKDMPTEVVTAENGQSMCPVMTKNPINPDIFVEYQGKKVYFCCDDCKDEFLKNPEKYVAKLPQFQKQEN